MTRMRTLERGRVEVDDLVLKRLRHDLDGQAITPDDDPYDEARTIWNGMIDRRPALILRCTTPSDVTHAIRFAHEHRTLLSVRGGGHNVAGNAICDDGIVVDLSPMRTVEVDPERRRARVDPGCTLADVDAATQRHGLALSTGINSTTGISGLTLGGGFGWLSRSLGLTADNLVGADVVLATGETVRASSEDHSDLYWAIRGGGGNFGIVTSFDFRVHPVGPEVLAGLIVHPLDQAGPVLTAFRDAAKAAPEELTAMVILRKAPPLPFIPDTWHGREVLVMGLCHVGPHALGEQAIAPFRDIGRPIAAAVGAHQFVDWQQAFDPLLTAGARNYWKSHDLLGLYDGLILVAQDFASRLPSDESEILIAQLGGAVNRVAASATAYPHRETEFIMNVHTRWRDPGHDDRCVAWARELFNAAAPFATGGVYVNFLSRDEGDRVRAAYGHNYGRLMKLKAKYDPDNLFRMNQNVPPA